MLKRIYALAKSYKDPQHWIINVLWRLPRSPSSLKVIFVLGAPRSGTTLLQNILASHRSLFSIEKETGLFSYQNFFASGSDHFGLGENITADIQKKSNDVVSYFENAVHYLMEKNNGRTFVEKTPQHSQYLRFILKYFPNAKIIHIVRDGRDCYCSARKNPGVIPQSGTVKEFAKYWKKCVTPPIIYKEYPQIITIKYEDLVDDPKTKIADIMSFLELSLEEQQLDPNFFGRDVRSRLEHFKMLNSSVSNQSAGRWEREMSETEKKFFLEIASHELTYYGYNDSYV